MPLCHSWEKLHSFFKMINHYRKTYKLNENGKYCTSIPAGIWEKGDERKLLILYRKKDLHICCQITSYF